MINEATMEDYKAINAIVKEGQDEHAQALPHIFRSIDRVMPEDYYQHLLNDIKSEIIVARLEDEVVGFAVMERIESPAFDSLVPRAFAYMNDFGVKNNNQRNGIGRALFKACVTWAKVKGASSLELNVWEFNEKAMSFYESFGMETISRKMSLSFTK
ncbi:GNAT family N-acetyltransferase [Bacillus massiliigorillae]|uniref:GNAT family N-acetyltransferase n=1 Tax=Bacillus massiliigorillae TaxID=1243664 RepID=UPI001E390223|nr:GNAT family N-acetyltransferase [Bacillus massiliigorillae]